MCAIKGFPEHMMRPGSFGMFKGRARKGFTGVQRLAKEAGFNLYKGERVKACSHG